MPVNIPPAPPLLYRVRAPLEVDAIDIEQEHAFIDELVTFKNDIAYVAGNSDFRYLEVEGSQDANFNFYYDGSGNPDHKTTCQAFGLEFKFKFSKTNEQQEIVYLFELEDPLYMASYYPFAPKIYYNFKLRKLYIEPYRYYDEEFYDIAVMVLDLCLKQDTWHHIIIQTYKYNFYFDGTGWMYFWINGKKHWTRAVNLYPGDSYGGTLHLGQDRFGKHKMTGTFSNLVTWSGSLIYVDQGEYIDDGRALSLFEAAGIPNSAIIYTDASFVCNAQVSYPNCTFFKASIVSTSALACLVSLETARDRCEAAKLAVDNYDSVETFANPDYLLPEDVKKLFNKREVLYNV